MPSLTSNKLLTSIARSQLVEPAELESAINSLREKSDGKIPTDVKRVSDFFLNQELLTSWQLQKLLAGKTRGFQLGKYRLLSHLGRGGMGSVYLALHVGMQRRVALKILPTDLVNDKSYLERFQREARVAASLDHPHIVRAYDFDQSGNLYYLVMEFIEGQDLAALVKQRSEPLPVYDAVRWISQTARALQHAHERGIIHRDVKPSNLLIDLKGNAKLLDLGLARLAGKDASSVTVNNNEGVLGTADYLAPEQAIDSHSADARADVYSLGCTLYFALVGHPPFHEGTIAQRIAQHQQAMPRPISGLRSEVGQGLDAVCQKMLAKDPEDRYASAVATAEALEEAVPPESSVETGQRLPFTSLPMSSKIVSDSTIPVVSDITTDDATTSSIKTRLQRPVRVKKPPVLMWITMGLLVMVAIVLAVIVSRQW